MRNKPDEAFLYRVLELWPTSAQDFFVQLTIFISEFFHHSFHPCLHLPAKVVYVGGTHRLDGTLKQGWDQAV